MLPITYLFQDQLIDRNFSFYKRKDAQNKEEEKKVELLKTIAKIKKNEEVILIEKMNMLGRKLLITGKGRW